MKKTMSVSLPNVHFLTVMGGDKPGIIAKVTKLLLGLECNLEDITMTLLDGQFAMMIMFREPRNFSEKKFVSAIKHLMKTDKLYAYSQKLKPSRPFQTPQKKSNVYLIHSIGPDRTGIVCAISSFLARLGLNITDLNSKCLMAGSKPLYAMALETQVDKARLSKLQKGLALIAERLGIDIKINPVHEYQM